MSVTAIYFTMRIDFSEYSFMHMPHYLTETLRKTERNNGFFVSAEAGRKKLYEIYFFNLC